MAEFGPLFPYHGFREILDSGLPLQAKVSSIIKEGHWALPPTRCRVLLELQGSSDLPSTSEDEIVWIPSKNRAFNASATWNFLTIHSLLVPWYSLVWFNGSLRRHSFICLLAFLNKLATMDKLLSWLRNISPDCLFYDRVESRDHIFFLVLFPLKFGSQ